MKQRRQQRSTSEKAAIVARINAGVKAGASIESECRKEKVNFTNYYQWRKRLDVRNELVKLSRAAKAPVASTPPAEKLPVAPAPVPVANTMGQTIDQLIKSHVERVVRNMLDGCTFSFTAMGGES